VKPFRSPQESLGHLDPEATGALIAAAGDISLIIGADGEITDVAFNSSELAREGATPWVGKRWVDTVTVESRPKVEELIDEARAGSVQRWRQVNHPMGDGPDLPIIYNAMQIGGDRLVAVGRDLRAFATLQQRLVDVQLSLERDYARLRDFETRYRLLFQMTSEPVLIVDAQTYRIMESNPAATKHFAGTKTSTSRSFLDRFDEDSRRELQTLLERVRAVGRADEVQVRRGDDSREYLASAFLFRHERSLLFLVRLAPLDAGAVAVEESAIPRTRARFVQVLENAPDGFVLTGPDMTIITANAAFLEMTQLATEAQAQGQPLERWLGRSAVDLNVLVANVREHGSVRLFSTLLHGEYGVDVEVEVSGVQVMTGEQSCFGFMIRQVERRPAVEGKEGAGLPRSVEQLTELVGRVSLKEIVRETTDVVERLCIEAALELSGDNRASAAEMLGLSRQSLYVKLRRYGLGDLSSEINE
jgi:transcriptional regulator PpsR